MEAFKSTLAEVRAADLVLLVADASDAGAERQIRAVQTVLEEIGANQIPSVLVLNKCDLISAEELTSLQARHPDAGTISAREGTGLAGLLYRVAREASRGDATVTVLVPFSKGILMKMVHERCQVLREVYTEQGLLATVSASERMRSTLAPYVVPDEALSDMDHLSGEWRS